MKLFIAFIGIILLAVVLWLFINKPDSPSGLNTQPNDHISQANQATDGTEGTDQAGTDTDSSNTATVSTRFSGARDDNRRESTTSRRQDSNNLDIASTYLTATDLAILYQQLEAATDPEDYYYRYRILKECNDLRLRGIDQQLETCESIAEHTARGSSQSQPGVDEQFAAAEIAEACFNITDRCTNLDFDNIAQTPSEALQEAIENGSVLAHAANLYQLSEADPLEGREWLVDALNSDPSPDLLRHAASFLRSTQRIRGEPFYGATDATSLTLAERALDLTACQLQGGCTPSSLFMLERCNYLPGCLPGQSYEQWLFLAYGSDPEGLNAVLQLGQDYQQFLINQQARALIFPEPVEPNP